MAMMVGFINTKPYSSTASDAMIAPQKKYNNTLLHVSCHRDGECTSTARAPARRVHQHGACTSTMHATGNLNITAMGVQ